MKKEEVDYLKLVHKGDGLDYYHSIERISDMSNSQQIFKNIRKQYKEALSRIEKLKEEIEKLKEKNREQRNTITELKTNTKIPLSKKSDSKTKEMFLKDIASEEDLKLRRKIRPYIIRLQTNMVSGTEYTRSDFKKDFQLNYKILDDLLRIMESDGIITRRVENGFNYYSLS